MRKRMGYAKRSIMRRMSVVVIAAIVLAGVLFVRLDMRLRPMIESYGLQAARRSGMLAIHDGVQQVLSEQPTMYSDLIAVTRDEGGRVLSVQTNITAVNLLKSRATAEVIRRLQESGEQIIRIPTGNLLGGSFFVGRGPYLPFKIQSSGSVVTTLEDAFSDAGINQTCHRLYLNMSLSMTVLLPSQRCHVDLQTAFLVCETVLAGEVPQAYADLDLNAA